MSSKTLKCIGGPGDGRIVTLADGVQHFVVRIGPPSRVLVGYPEPGPDFVQYREHLYVLDWFTMSGGDRIEFLRPDNWTTRDVAQHVLGVSQAAAGAGNAAQRAKAAAGVLQPTWIGTPDGQ